MYLIITCKHEKEQRRKIGDIVFPIISLSDVQGQLTPPVGGPIRPKFELIRALMHVIVTFKYEKKRMKTAEKKWRHPFFHHNPVCYHGNQRLDLAKFQTHPSSDICYHYLQVWQGSDQEKPRKSGDFIFPIISLWRFFQTLKGSLLCCWWSDQAEIWTRPSSNACHYCQQVWKRSDEKTAEKKWRHRFLHYNPMRDFCCHGNQSSDPIWPKTLCSLSPNQMMLQIKLSCDQPTDCRDIHVWKCGRRTMMDGRWTMSIL